MAWTQTSRRKCWTSSWKSTRMKTWKSCRRSWGANFDYQFIIFIKYEWRIRKSQPVGWESIIHNSLCLRRQVPSRTQRQSHRHQHQPFHRSSQARLRGDKYALNNEDKSSPIPGNYLKTAHFSCFLGLLNVLDRTFLVFIETCEKACSIQNNDIF